MPKQQLLRYVGALMLLWLVLGACGRLRGAPDDLAGRCILLEGSPGPLSDAPMLTVDRGRSPAYCSDQRVRSDFLAAMAWYEVQATQMEQARTYPPTLAAGFADYYTGDLLHRARETLYYNELGGRIVFGRWDDLQIADLAWGRSGASAVLTIRVGGYEFVALTPPPARPEAGPDDQSGRERPNRPRRPGGPPPPDAPPRPGGAPRGVVSGRAYERWQVTMQYDRRAGRWKLAQATSLFDF